MDVCINPEVLKVIYFLMLILNIVKIAVPIGLIIMGMIDFSKSAVTNDNGVQKKNVNLFVKRTIFAVLIFIVPWIVKVVIVGLGDLTKGINYTDCLDNGNSECIQALETKNMLDINNYCDVPEDFKIEDNIGSSDNKDNNGSSDNEDNNGSSDNKDNSNVNNSFDNYGEGRGGKYFSPIQSVNVNVSSNRSTAGCSNQAYHDLNGIEEGTPIYAGMDGEAYFYQKYCSSNNELYSYGNMVKITASDKTYIIYAHLKKFPDNVINSSNNDNYITASCPKKGSSAPCPASSCSGSIKTNNIATLNVKKGDLIGYLGNTGNSTGPHLHVEIHEKGGSACLDLKEAFGLK